MRTNPTKQPKAGDVEWANLFGESDNVKARLDGARSRAYMLWKKTGRLSAAARFDKLQREWEVA